MDFQARNRYQSESDRIRLNYLLVVVAATSGIVYYLRTPDGKAEWDRLCIRVWLLGDLVRKFETARFARTLGALLRGGVPLLEALGTVQGVVGNRLLARAMGKFSSGFGKAKGCRGRSPKAGCFRPSRLI